MSGYEADRWHGAQALGFSHVNAARLESTRASDLAMSPGGCPGSALGRARFILLAGESDS